MSLRAELGALRSEARALRSLLERLEERIRDLEASAGFELVEPETPPRSAPRQRGVSFFGWLLDSGQPSESP